MIDPAGRLALAVDVGGTKMAAGIVDRHGVILAGSRVPTAGDAEQLFASLMGLVDEVMDGAAAQVVVCGVGCGGPMTGHGELVSPLNISGWRDFPLRDRLAEALGLPAFVDNDAKALALAEGWVGAARGESDYLAMVVSTGVGAGIVCDGRLLDGAEGNAGHLGHVTVEPDGRRCGCGARGCLEAEASGTAIAAITGAPAREASASVRRRTGTMVGRAVAGAVTLLDLRLACVAGSVALGFGDDFFDAAQAEIDERARLGFARGAIIRPAGCGADGPLIGAAAVGWRGLGEELPGSSGTRSARTRSARTDEVRRASR